MVRVTEFRYTEQTPPCLIAHESRAVVIVYMRAMHLWSPRRHKSTAVKRSMSSPAAALVTANSTSPSSSSPQPLSLAMGKSEENALQEEVGEGGGRRTLTEVAREGISAARDALMGNGSSSFAGKERKEEGWAPGLFYAYARRVCSIFFSISRLWIRKGKSGKSVKRNTQN